MATEQGEGGGPEMMSKGVSWQEVVGRFDGLVVLRAKPKSLSPRRQRKAFASYLERIADEKLLDKIEREKEQRQAEKEAARQEKLKQKELEKQVRKEARKRNKELKQVAEKLKGEPDANESKSGAGKKGKRARKAKDDGRTLGDEEPMAGEGGGESEEIAERLRGTSRTVSASLKDGGPEKSQS